MKTLHKAKWVLCCSTILASLLVVLVFTPAHATATTSKTVMPNVSNASCNKSGAEEIYAVNQTHGNEVRQIQLWYSTSSRCVWAQEVNGQAGDYIDVNNLDTGAYADAYLTGSTGSTSAIDDAGTQSEACMIPDYINGVYTGPPICTSSY